MTDGTPQRSLGRARASGSTTAATATTAALLGTLPGLATALLACGRGPVANAALDDQSTIVEHDLQVSEHKWRGRNTRTGEATAWSRSF